MRILITGKEGQIARSLIERSAGSGHDLMALGRPELDLAGAVDSIVRTVEEARPDLIVSAAAYTAVDKAESEPELAFIVNARAPAALARAANELGLPLVHLSTDYVFDGSKGSPYLEDDPPCPASVYGASKLAGEEAVLGSHNDVTILRTAWVYSPFGSNFVKTMLQLAKSRDEVAVVADQRGNPTSALDIAGGILRIAENLTRDSDPARRGIFHMTASGEASWAELAEAVFAASAECGGPTARVRYITTVDYPTPARRPADSRLDSSRLTRTYGVRLPDWRRSTEDVVGRLIRSAL